MTTALDNALVCNDRRAETRLNSVNTITAGEPARLVLPTGTSPAIREVTALLQQVAAFDSTGTTNYTYGNDVGGYAAVGNVGGVVDEFLPAAGVPINALFWLVMEGPSLVQADNASTFAIGDHVLPGTNGVAAAVTPSATAATLYGQVNGVKGRAMQALAVASSANIFVEISPGR